MLRDGEISLGNISRRARSDWVMASCRRGWRERKKKGKKKKKSIELSAFFPFFACLFIPLKFEPSVHIGGNLRKALPLQASETIVSFRGWAGFMEVAAWNFATRPGKAVFHREISLFIGRIESIGCLVILSNRFHAQTLVIFPCFREPLVGDRYFYPLFLSFSFFPPPLFLTNILSCLYLRACFGVKDGAGTNERRTKRRKWLRLGDTKEERDKRGENYFCRRKLGCLKIWGIDTSNRSAFLISIGWNVGTNLGKWLVVAILTRDLLRSLNYERNVKLRKVSRKSVILNLAKK